MGQKRKHHNNNLVVFIFGLEKFDSLKKTISLKQTLLSYGLKTLEQKKKLLFVFVHYLSL